MFLAELKVRYLLNRALLELVVLKHCCVQRLSGQSYSSTYLLSHVVTTESNNIAILHVTIHGSSRVSGQRVTVL